MAASTCITLCRHLYPSEMGRKTGLCSLRDLLSRVIYGLRTPGGEKDTKMRGSECADCTSGLNEAVLLGATYTFSTNSSDCSWLLRQLCCVRFERLLPSMTSLR